MRLEPSLEVSESLTQMINILTIFEASTMISNTMGDPLA